MEQRKYANMQRYTPLMRLAHLLDDWLLRGPPRQGQVSMGATQRQKIKTISDVPNL